jgi:hypothetical protein
MWYQKQENAWVMFEMSAKDEQAITIILSVTAA